MLVFAYNLNRAVVSMAEIKTDLIFKILQEEVEDFKSHD